MTVLRRDGFLPTTPQTLSWEGTVCKPFAPTGVGVPKHTSSIAHGTRTGNQRIPPDAGGSAFLPDLKTRGFLRRFQ
jgi:hypothetical protein